MSRPSRAELWARLGEPCEQQGSANAPDREGEHGVSWNEKWLYRDAAGGLERVVLWHRSDLVGVFRVEPGGSCAAEALAPDAARDA